MQIGELHRRTGVSHRSLRYYEQQGLIRPERQPSGYRVYRQADVTRVLHIRNLLAAGMSTTTIADVLPCLGSEGERSVVDCAETLIDLTREHQRIRAAIGELETAQRVLDSIIATAPPEIRAEAADLETAELMGDCAS